VDEEWVVNIFLDNACSLFVTSGGLVDNADDFIVILSYLNSISTVGILTWLDNPNVSKRSV
jgi:hypothetical protein